MRSVGTKSNQKYAFSSVDMRKLFIKCGRSVNLEELRFTAMAFISFAGFLRFDEVVRIKSRDLVVDSSQLKITIVSGKTDQFKKGETVVIARKKLAQ